MWITWPWRNWDSCHSVSLTMSPTCTSCPLWSSATVRAESRRMLIWCGFTETTWPYWSSTLNDSRSILKITPTVWVSSCTRLCSSYSPITLTPEPTSAASRMSLEKTETSRSERSERNVVTPLSTLTTRPVSSLCFPASTLMWSPGRNILRMLRAGTSIRWPSSASSRLSSVATSPLYASITPCTPACSPSNTSTWSPGCSSDSGPPLDALARRCRSTPAPPSAASEDSPVKRSTSSSDGLMSSVSSAVVRKSFSR